MAISKAPFRRGDVVKSNLSDMRFLREGKKYRVVNVESVQGCGSGWMVEVAELRRGPVPQNPSVIGRADSEWFERVGN